MEFEFQFPCITAVCLVLSVLFVPGIDGGQLCANCTETSQGARCYSHTTCREGEVCKMVAYMDQTGQIMYNYGCAVPQECQLSTGPTIIGRSLNSVPRDICRTCCNDTLLCNEMLSCEITAPRRSGQTCATCTGLQRGSHCYSHTTCDENEVCQMTSYRTDAGKILHDYGCAIPQACLHTVGLNLVGRQASGAHHGICNQCCNNTKMCNNELSCPTNPSSATALPRECSDLTLSTKKNGTYTIYPYGSQELPVDVRCEFDHNDQAWTVIQRRLNCSVSFNRTWQAYKVGFGSANGQYWIGNDIIYKLTSYAHHRLLVVLSDFEGVTKHAEYSSFSVGDESSAYVLHVDGYSGTAGDAMTSASNGNKFSTIDRDNDVSTGGDCVKQCDGAWWYSNCAHSFLNGQYIGGHYAGSLKGIVWYYWRGWYYSLKTSTMMIRMD